MRRTDATTPAIETRSGVTCERSCEPRVATEARDEQREQ